MFRENHSMKLSIFLFREIIYNGHLQSLSAVGVVYVSSLLLGFAVSIPLLVIVYLLFQPIYLFDRYRDVDIDEQTNQARSLHLRFYRNRIPALVIFLLILLSALVFVFSNVFMFILSAIIVVFGFLYPLFFKELTRIIPLFKNLYVALVFALLVFVPHVFYDNSFMANPLLIFLFFYILLEGIIMQSILDYKDIESDRERNLKTLPVMVGLKKSKKIVLGLSTLLLIVSISTVYLFNFEPIVYVLIAVLFVTNIISNNWAAHKKIKGFILISAKFIIVFFAFIIGSMIV